MDVKLISYTPEPQKVVAAAAKLCYSKSDATHLLDNLSDDKASAFIERLANLGHASPIEHVCFTFAISGISRACLAQLTRHRIASYSVQSQRYVDMTAAQFVIPPEIQADEDATAVFASCIEDIIHSYNELRGILAERQYTRLKSEFPFLSDKELRYKAEKFANEDARFVLPNACQTNLVMTMNARSLHNFFGIRCCNRAQWEIRELAEKMFALVYKVAPNLFAKTGPNCVATGTCPQGDLSCMKKKAVLQKFERIKRSGGVSDGN